MYYPLNFVGNLTLSTVGEAGWDSLMHQYFFVPSLSPPGAPIAIKNMLCNGSAINKTILFFDKWPSLSCGWAFKSLCAEECRRSTRPVRADRRRGGEGVE